MTKQVYSISFCVVCMNRLHQLKQTLLQNIIDNKDYPQLEFIVLDYNSKDGMEDWIKENFSEYIDNGRLIYYKTTDPNSWSPSHSKNLAFKLATGDIVCSIWADYYTGSGFADYVNQNYQRDNNIVLTPIDFYKTKKNYNPPGDVLGKVCVNRSDFLKIEGFDERMNRHGFEDYDFINRLEMIGVKRVLIEDFTYLKYISHDNNERYTLPKDNIEGMYINYISPSMSEILILYKDQNFNRATFIDNSTNGADNYIYAYEPRNYHFEYTLKGSRWETGNWKKTENTIDFSITNNTHFNLAIKNQNNSNLLFDIINNVTFYNVKDDEVVNNILVFNHFYYTRSLMEESLKNKVAIINNGNFGNATVFKNFQSEPISI